MDMRILARNFHPSQHGPGVTTAHILYYYPDYPNVITTMTWQTNDTCPEFPVLNRFATWWDKTIQGRIHSILVAHNNSRLVEMRRVDGEFRLQ